MTKRLTSMIVALLLVAAALAQDAQPPADVAPAPAIEQTGDDDAPVDDESDADVAAPDDATEDDAAAASDDEALAAEDELVQEILEQTELIFENEDDFDPTQDVSADQLLDFPVDI